MRSIKQIVLATVSLASLGLTAASAADMPIQRPVYKASVYSAPVNDWSGLTVSVLGGSSWGSVTTATSQVDPVTKIHGGDLGVTFGGRKQFDWLVVGAEIGVIKSWQKSKPTDVSWSAWCLNYVQTEQYKMDWMGRAVATVGFLPTPNLLVYGMGGLAFGQFSHTRDFSATYIHGPLAYSTRNWDKYAGVGTTFGFGAEYKLNRNWSVKAEVSRSDFGNFKTGYDSSYGSSGWAKQSSKNTMALVGVSYQF